MSKTRSITELIQDLQDENESLKSLKRAFNQALRDEFGYDAKELHRIVEIHELHERRKAEKASHSSSSTDYNSETTQAGSTPSWRVSDT